jgi:dCTP diphosphatase
MKPIDAPHIHEELVRFAKDRDWDQFHSIKNLAMALSVEASELLELFQWMTEEQSNGAKQDPALKSKIQDEVADVFIYLLRLAAKADVDIGKAVSEKMIKNSQKYPVDKSKGNSKKYDAL